MYEAEDTLSEAARGEEFDLLVAGGGVAGLFAALCAASEGRVLVLTKGPLLASTSSLAQGGIAAAVGEDDSPALHAEDTLRTGRGLSRPSAVSVLTGEASARIRDLVDMGVEFDDGLGLEGGHSRRRVVHAGGAATGDRVARALAERVLEHPGIQVVEGARLAELWTAGGRCVGAVTDHGAVRARATLVATGGAAALWQRTTNPPGAVGEGIAAAYRAGAAVADLEFTQFHPTTLVDSSLLLSEALRGEGALLLDENGERFTDELAPRDVVAREIAARGTALLDLRAIDRARFPSLMGSLEERGYDPAEAPIPVAPAAHYTVGGIVTDLDGRSELPGLYAAGECAATGVHGANRLASNSLLECLVFGRRAALAAHDEPALPRDLGSEPDVPAQEPVTPELRRALWRDCGLVRDAAGLERLDFRAAPPRAARRAERARARGEPRVALPRRLPSRGRALRAPRRPPTRVGALARDMVVAEDTLRVVYAALMEDVGAGDVTTEATVDADVVGTADLVVKEPGVVCGLEAAEAVFRTLDSDIRFERVVDDGAVIGGPTVVATVTGPKRAILTGERTALNFLGRLSGVATLTRSYADAVAGTGAAILDTRKTTPGLRLLEKHAVACGGGRNHRFGLDDAVLIKDNHLQAAAGSVSTAVARVRELTDLPIEVECDTLEQVSEALAEGVDAILLDNMTADGLRAAVALVAGRARLEASGGVTLENVRAVAETGVDEISVGALTHSARSLDVSLELT